MEIYEWCYFYSSFFISKIFDKLKRKKEKSHRYHPACLPIAQQTRLQQQEAMTSLKSTPIWSLTRFFCFCFCFFKGRTNKLGLIVILWHFCDTFQSSFRSQDVSGLWFSGPVVHGSGCHPDQEKQPELWLMIIPKKSNISTLTVLLTTSTFVTWLWLIGVQLTEDCSHSHCHTCPHRVRGHERKLSFGYS